MMDMYILDGKQIEKTTDVKLWGEFMEGDRHVNLTRFEDGLDVITVSTVFLGLDHNMYMGGQPLLFETLIFGGEHGGFYERYSTWEDANKGHEHIAKSIENGTFKEDDN